MVPHRHLSVLHRLFLTCSSLSYLFLSLCSFFYHPSTLWCLFPVLCFLPLSPSLFPLVLLLTFCTPFPIFFPPPQTSVGPFASNNPCNSRVIEKQVLSGGTSWRKSYNKKIGLDDQNSLSLSVHVCVCYMCIMYSNGCLPSSRVHGQCLLWPHMPSFCPQIYTQY